MASESSEYDAPHLLHVTYDGGWWDLKVSCPNAALGKDRPCAVWANEDGTERLDDCTFQQYSEALANEEWLSGRVTFPPIPIVAVGSGENWSAAVQPVPEREEVGR